MWEALEIIKSIIILYTYTLDGCQEVGCISGLLNNIFVSKKGFNMGLY